MAVIGTLRRAFAKWRGRRRVVLAALRYWQVEERPPAETPRRRSDFWEELGARRGWGLPPDLVDSRRRVRGPSRPW